jgi:hypothetical protein
VHLFLQIAYWTMTVQIRSAVCGEQHVKEDLGRIPTAQDWLSQIKPQRWMYGQRLAIERSRLPSDVK